LRPEVGPRKYGFDQSYGYLHGQIDPYTHRYKNGDRTWHRNDEFLDEKGHATDLIADEAVRFVTAKREKPFFLWAAFSVPHHPLQEEEKWLAPYRDSVKDPSRRLFAAAVTHMDDAVGRVVEALEKSGQVNHTLILFTSDNGGQRDWSSKTEYDGRYAPQPTLGDNRPLRGWKGGLYEGGVRVPAFVHWRGRLKPAEVREVVSVLDWFPTLAGVAGAAVPAGARLDGQNVWPVLTGEEKSLAPRTLYWNTGGLTGVMTDGWKLIVPKGKAAVELYHLPDDPEEKKDLAGARPQKVEELTKTLEGQRRLDP
jgi:arylsulfatase A-like enzyme